MSETFSFYWWNCKNHFLFFVFPNVFQEKLMTLRNFY